MRDPRSRMRGSLGLGAGILILAAGLAAAEPKIKPLAVGLSYENLSRTVVWKGDPDSSRIKANLVSARADLGFGKGIVLSLNAGLALSDFEDLIFDDLPISLQYGGSALKGLLVGAEVVAPLHRFSDFELSGTGRILAAFGMSKTWPLEGFAVEGEAEGTSNWMEAAVGPRISYLFFGRFVPYIEISARWLRASFKMTETLDDLTGGQTKRVSGDLSFSAALGASARVSDRIAVEAKAGILPFAGGVDSLVSVGILYKF